MGLSNCTLCGKVFNQTGRNVCPSCWEREQQVYERVAEYIHEHPEADAAEVIAQTDVSLPDLEQLLKRGLLLTFEHLAATVLRCQRCREPVLRGSFCKTCTEVLKEGFAEGVSDDNEPQQGKRTQRRASEPGGKASARENNDTSRGEYWRDRAQR